MRHGAGGSRAGRRRRSGILLLQHEIPEPTNAHAIRSACAAGWFVVLNPAPARPVMPALLPLIDIVAPNETEAAGLTGASDPMQAARRLVAQGTRAALVTPGSGGALGPRCGRRAALSRGDTAGG